MALVEKKKHFVLVHGACHGAWSWYKVKPVLESEGHRVSLVDLNGSGTNLNHINQVYTFYDYTKPLLDLLESVDPGQKVILVGHSLGGLNLGLAMDTFPNKISAAVFLTAFAPDTLHSPSYVLQQSSARTPAEAWLDTQFLPYGSNDQTGVSMFFGPKFLSHNLYQLCPIEDLELGKILLRPSSLFIEDLSKRQNFTIEGFGSVKRVYVVCDEDKAIPLDYQRWMIHNAGIQHVMEIQGADHMPMFSKPQELCRCLLEIATKYA